MNTVKTFFVVDTQKYSLNRNTYGRCNEISSISDKQLLFMHNDQNILHNVGVNSKHYHTVVNKTPELRKVKSKNLVKNWKT